MSEVKRYLVLAPGIVALPCTYQIALFTARQLRCDMPDVEVRVVKFVEVAS